jgi:hypothetical protein
MLVHKSPWMATDVVERCMEANRRWMSGGRPNARTMVMLQRWQRCDTPVCNPALQRWLRYATAMTRLQRVTLRHYSNGGAATRDVATL